MPETQSVDVIAEDLKTLRDDLRVQAKLAAMELRDEWHKLEKRHAALQNVDDAAQEAWHELRDGYRALRDQLTGTT